MTAILGWTCACVLLALSLLVAYQWLLAIVSLLPGDAQPSQAKGERRRFLILVPAHDEESGLADTLDSLARQSYPGDLVTIAVVADRCHDGTAAVARATGVECLERHDGRPGKGAAIKWAIDVLRARGTRFDALVVVDADTLADRGLLEAFNGGLRAGRQVQQAYNYLSNPWETPFTRIIAVTAILRNGLFYGGKARLGLSAMLTGSGMCFSRRILERYDWTAFSVGEDWEYSAFLLLHGEEIHFNRRARVLARESRDFAQASSQRLRWAGGRHAVAASGGRELFATGIRQRRLLLCDAALTLAAPTYSAQATLAVLSLGLAMASGSLALVGWAAAVTALLAAYFLLGALLTEAPLRALAGIALIPAFLPWRMTIEILGLVGFGRKRWVRTSRLPASR